MPVLCGVLCCLAFTVLPSLKCFGQVQFPFTTHEQCVFVFGFMDGDNGFWQHEMTIVSNCF